MEATAVVSSDRVAEQQDLVPERKGGVTKRVQIEGKDLRHIRPQFDIAAVARHHPQPALVLAAGDMGEIGDAITIEVGPALHRQRFAQG